MKRYSDPVKKAKKELLLQIDDLITKLKKTKDIDKDILWDAEILKLELVKRSPNKEILSMKIDEILNSKLEQSLAKEIEQKLNL